MKSEPNIYQVQEEMDQFLSILSVNPPHAVLEIGTAQGGSLKEWAKVAADDAVLIGVDVNVPEGFIARQRQEVHLISGDSKSQQTFRQITQVQKWFDFLFIDGGHEYENVEADFELYSPLVIGGGIIALHDIVPGPKSNVGGVPEYWKSLKASFSKHRELVTNWQQGGYGIGVLFV